MSERQCEICGNSFKLFPHLQDRQRYCSRKCSRIIERITEQKKRQLKKDSRIPIIKNCPYCLKDFTPPKNPYATHCSEDCQSKDYRKRNPEKVRQWSREARRKFPERIKEYNSNFRDRSYFGGQRRLVWLRDKFACTECDKSYPTSRIVVHHKDEDKKNNTMENLVTLCCSCHAKAHAKLNGREHYVQMAYKANKKAGV